MRTTPRRAGRLLPNRPHRCSRVGSGRRVSLATGPPARWPPTAGHGLRLWNRAREADLRDWRDHLPAGSDLGPDGLTSSGSLLRAWSDRWEAAPGAPLWLDTRGAGPDTGRGRPGRPGDWWTAGEFDAATRRVAGRLRGAGLGPGDRVVWSAPSSVAALAAHVGALRAGLVVVPANPAYSERELTHIVTDVRPAAAIVDRADQAAWVRAGLGRDAASWAPTSTSPTPIPVHWTRSEPDDPALICYTSGTTGAPKGAVLQPPEPVGRHRGGEDRLALGPGRPAGPLPPGLPRPRPVRRRLRDAVGRGLGRAAPRLRPGRGGRRGPVAGGVDVLRRPHHVPPPGGVRARLRPRGAPPVRVRLGPAARRAPRRGQRGGGLGGARAVRHDRDADERLQSLRGGAPARARWGSPCPGSRCSSAPATRSCVRGPNVFGGYWERPAATADAFAPSSDDGPAWFRTGDLGADDDGYLVIRGRSKELIISGGLNVYPAEVEDVLAAHPRVAEVAVTGTPSEEWGEVVTAWVVADGRPPRSTIWSISAPPTLAPYKRPRVVHVVDDLPRNALGKVVRNQLGRVIRR